MIFKWNPKQPDPKDGDIRIVTKFVWWKTIGDETRSVMVTSWQERYRCYEFVCREKSGIQVRQYWETLCWMPMDYDPDPRAIEGRKSV